MPTNLDIQLLNWLNEQGYPLEMAVARLCRIFGFKAIQSEYYADPESDIQREIDVVAHRQTMAGDVLLRVSMNFECKNSKDKPWVIFSSPDIQLAPPARVVQRAGSHLAIQFLQLLAQKEEIQNLPLFSFPQRLGYGVTQAFSGGQDVPYTACMNVAKSAAAASRSGNIASKFQGPFSDIILPVVVVEGRLFEFYLGDDNNPIIEEIKSGTLVWRNPIVGASHTVIHILTIDDLSNFLQQVNTSVDVLFSRNLEIDQLNDIAKQIEGPQWRSRQLSSGENKQKST